MNQKPSVLLLEHHLKALKLPTFLRDYASVGAVCGQERADYPTYLLRLAERELIDRERRATERRIREAAFPVLKTIETFAFAAQPSINEPLMRELLRGEYIGKRENILLVGNPGTGKTHLASALGFAACTQGKRVRFTTTTGLVTQLLEQRDNKTLQRLHKQLERLDVIILDELGYVPFSKAGAELLFDVVSRAYERTSLIVTTNLPFEQWTEVLGSERLAEKELLAYLVAHNLVRCGMAEAVARQQVELERLSFKGSLDALRQYSAAIAQAPNRKLRRQLWEDLLLNLARDLVPRRPNRREPRAVKHRPKAYPLLNQPRRRFIEISHRSRYWKGRPRNYRGLN
jgi:DNA replication protein DnaC